MKKLNIVMTVHNRWELTKQSLDSLIKHTDPKLYSLHVIDDRSLEENYKKLMLYWGRQDESIEFELYQNINAISPGASRNYVCRKITQDKKRGEYLYHSDNDVFFTPEWLEKLIDAFEWVKPVVKVLGGGCHPYLQNKEVIQIDLQKKVGIKDAVSGYSQLMTWDIWDKYGPFDETMRDAEIKIMGSEDWAFCRKIVETGYKVGSIEPEIVIHTGKTNTYGNPSTGSETFKNIEGVLIK